MPAHRATLCLAVSLTAAWWRTGLAASPPDTAPAPGRGGPRAGPEADSRTRGGCSRTRSSPPPAPSATSSTPATRRGSSGATSTRSAGSAPTAASASAGSTPTSNEADTPAHPGRWAAYVEGTAPNGTPVRRSLTLYCRPPGFLLFFFPPDDLPDALPQKTSTIAPEVWDEHRDELSRLPRTCCSGR